MTSSRTFLLEAIALARANVARGGRPFGAVVVKDEAIIARGVNEMLASNDPTAHAELLALRAAGQALGKPTLTGCVVYASGQPCPMCVAAMRMSDVREATFAYSNDDGAPYGLTTAAIYAELLKPLPALSVNLVHLPVRTEGEPDLYAQWQASAGGRR